jgi:hypothetical protein
MELPELLSQELENLHLPVGYKVDVRPYSEVYPEDPNQQNSQFVQISIGSSRRDSTHDNGCSYLDFWFNPDQRRIEHVNLSLKKKMKNRGFSRGLVEAMEKIGVALECHSIRINLNTNTSFWEHMGYKRQKESWDKDI